MVGAPYYYRVYDNFPSTMGADKKEGTTLAKVLERDIQKGICDWLRQREVFFWRSNNIPVFSTSNDGVRRFRSLPKDTPRGLPDIMIVHEGKFIALEVKRPGAKLRPEQAEFGIKLCTHGGQYYKVQSLDEVKRIFIDLTHAS